MDSLKAGRPCGRAVVLAAGMGTRLGAAARQLPKCLVEVNGVSILANALSRLSGAGIRETTIVIGHLADVVRTCIGPAWRSMTISYIINTEYRTTGTSCSLWLATRHLEDEMILLEGDVFFAAPSSTSCWPRLTLT